MNAHEFDPKEPYTTESDHSGGGTDNREGERDFDRDRPGLKHARKLLFIITISVSSFSRKVRSR